MSYINSIDFTSIDLVSYCHRLQQVGNCTDKSSIILNMVSINGTQMNQHSSHKTKSFGILLSLVKVLSIEDKELELENLDYSSIVMPMDPFRKSSGKIVSVDENISSLRLLQLADGLLFPT